MTIQTLLHAEEVRDALDKARVLVSEEDGRIYGASEDVATLRRLEDKYEKIVLDERRDATRRLGYWVGLFKADDFHGSGFDDDDEYRDLTRKWWDDMARAVARTTTLNDDADKMFMEASKIAEDMADRLDDFSTEHYYVREEVADALSCVLLRSIY